MSLTQEHLESVVTQEQLKRERLRFINFQFNRTPAGQCTAEVELEWLGNTRVVGHVEGRASPLGGDLRLSAEAALQAIVKFSDGELELELIGVKAMRAFDANIVIVSVASTRDGRVERLLGSYLAEHDPLRGAVIAVLNATNRVLGNFISTR
jgi:hypothetical protein